MRHLFSIVLLSIMLTATAQQPNTMCGTVVDEGFKARYAARDRSNYDQVSADSRAGIRWVPVYYHLITKDDGKGGPSLKKTFESHCELNEAYLPFNIGFFIAGIDTIKSTALWTYDNDWLGYQAFNNYNVDNVCNIFINGNLPGLCGFATFPGSFEQSGGGLFLSINCIGAGTNTIQHEMGHYLGLMHTFDDSYGIEFVNGTNCANRGDLFCDTPADFLDDRTPCPYNGDQQDPNGDYYRTVVDETLYMSYFYDQCVNRFSTMQQVEMNNVLDENDRNYLLNQPVPNVNELDSTAFVTPLPGDTTLLPGSSTFRWRAIPGAAYYIFTLRSATASTIFADTLVTDTFYTFGNISPNRQYRYKVRGISYGNACSQGTSFQIVKTSTIKATVNVVAPSCSGNADAAITLTPTINTGVAPFTVTWSNGITGPDLTNIGPGDYVATITDANGEVATVNIVVPATTPLTGNVNAVGPNLNAYGAGGTPPYTYQWSNGVNSQFNNNVAPTGEYTVTITDASGCTSTNSFNFTPTGIGNATAVNAMLRVFPNPANGANLNVEVSLDVAVRATVRLVNMNGQVVTEIMGDMNAGTNLLNIDIANMPAGIYALQFNNGAQVKSQRVSIMK